MAMLNNQMVGLKKWIYIYIYIIYIYIYIHYIYIHIYIYGIGTSNEIEVPGQHGHWWWDSRHYEWPQLGRLLGDYPIFSGHMLLSATCHRRDLRTVIGADTPMTCFVHVIATNRNSPTTWFLQFDWWICIWSSGSCESWEVKDCMSLGNDWRTMCSAPRESRFATAVA